MAEYKEADKESINQAIIEIQEEMEGLRSALAALDSEPAQEVSGGGARAVAQTNTKKAKKSRKRAPRGQRREQILSTIKSHPGIKAAQLARDVDAQPSAVHQILKKLVDAGDIKKNADKGYEVAEEANL